MSVQGSYRPEIDGLRAISVIAVLIFHLDRGVLPGGFLGVDVFFVISGYLITRLLLDEVHSGDSLQAIAVRFYRRRVLRIMPLYSVVSLSCLVVGWFVLLPADFVRTLRTALYGAVFQANRSLAETASYFAPEADAEPLLHTWSLSIEEQFYLIWPVLLFVISRRMGARRLLVVGVTTGVLVLASQLLAIGTDGVAYFLLRARAFEPLIGACIALSLHARPAWRVRIPGAGLVGLLVMIGSFFVVDRNMDLPGVAALVPTLAAALLIVSSGWVHTALAFPPLVWLGRISYALYLVHWPVLCFVRYVGISIDLRAGGLIVAGCLVLSAACHRWIEQPLRYRPWPLWRSVLVLVVAPLVLVGSAVLVAARSDDFADRLSPRARHLMALASQFPHELRRACHGAALDDIERCTLGAALPATAVLWGDSHANHYTGLVDELGKGRGVAFHDVTANTCPPLLDARDVPAACLRRNEQVLSWISGRPQILTVVLAGAWSKTDPRGLGTTVDALRGAGKRVVILTEVPELPIEKVDCPIKAEFYDWVSLSCAFPDRSRRRDAQLERLLRGLAGRKTASIIDVLRLMCDGATCRQELDGVPLYRQGDRGHLNMEGSRALGRALLRSTSTALP